MVRARAGSRSTMRSPTASGRGDSKRRRGEASPCVEHADPHRVLTRADRGTQPGRKSVRCAGDRLHPHVDAGRSEPLAVTNDRVAAGEVVAVDPTRLSATRVPGPTRSSAWWAVSIPRTRAVRSSRTMRTVSSIATGPAGQRAGHHRAGAARREHPVDPEPRPVAVHRCARGRQHVVESRAQVIEPATRTPSRRRRRARRSVTTSPGARRRRASGQLEQIGVAPCRPW